MKKRWDIFCRVVDNFGDIGVCWRLARQLAGEYGLEVRLWVDDLAAFARLFPAILPEQDAQTADGVLIRRWASDFPRAAADVADVVIEAFACDLPQEYLEAMAQQPVVPVWINLEYLSAEDWIIGCHGMSSPHPRLPLTKHFFFPGFLPSTGGLLREAGYDERRAHFDAASCRRRLGLPVASNGALCISLFGYENSALPGLLKAWTRNPRPIELLVPEGRLTSAVADFFGPGPWQREGLTAHSLPFLPQPDYDELLWLCDLNFVRGEDSFVRAQWAEKPFVWHIYPQDEEHQRVKLAAFLDRYLKDCDVPWADALTRFWWAWEMGKDAGKAWPDFSDALSAIGAHSQAWSKRLKSNGDLAGKLLSFVMKSM